MFTKAVRRRSMLAMAGVTAAVASATVAPSAANAQENEPAVELREIPVGELSPVPLPAPEMSAQDHGTCFGWTRLRTNLGTYVFLPTTAQDNGQTHCNLGSGNQTDGVYKLQRALDLCPPQQSVTADRIYGDDTVAAVKKVQDYFNITADGKYGPQTRNVMYWPEYNSSGDFINRCARLAF